MINKTFKSENTRQLETKITKLEADKELLRVYLHELIEAFYKTVNGKKETSSTWTFNSDLKPLFKNLKHCPKCGEPNYYYKKGGQHE